MKKRLLIIPARGGSKRIKNKNIKNFCGKPIIYYTIDLAKKTKLFHKIHVSTESKEILDCVKKKNILFDFLRTKKISGDKIPIFDVIDFVINKYKNSGFVFDEVWSISACAPLILSKESWGDSPCRSGAATACSSPSPRWLPA